MKKGIYKILIISLIVQLITFVVVLSHKYGDIGTQLGFLLYTPYVWLLLLISILLIPISIINITLYTIGILKTKKWKTDLIIILTLEIISIYVVYVSVTNYLAIIK